VERNTLRDLQGDLKTLSDKLDLAVQDVSPSRYVSARRYLNQLKDGVKALEQTRRGMALEHKVVGLVKNVAELCTYVSTKGLQFAPAVARGDEQCYSALYLSLRRFEMSVAGN